MHKYTAIQILDTPIYRTHNASIVKNNLFNNSDAPNRDIARTAPVPDLDRYSVSLMNSPCHFVLTRLIVLFPTEHPESAFYKTVVLVLAAISCTNNPILCIHFLLHYYFPFSSQSDLARGKITPPPMSRDIRPTTRGIYHPTSF